MTDIDYTRQRDFFDPEKVDARVTIVGCGGIGSFTGVALAKLGVREFKLVDFDHVEAHNVPNQFFYPAQVGMSKVDALAETISDTAGAIITGRGSPGPCVMPYEQSLQAGLPLSPIVISALDSMSARADLWNLVKNKLDCKLFLDGRLGAENVLLYAANPTLPSDQRGYEATLHTDAEGVDLPCTGRAIIDVGFAIGSLMTRAVRRYYAGEPHTPITYLNQQTLEIQKGDWLE